MPKYKINYSKSIIYKIHCIDPEVTDCYVGSTTNFNQKRYFHKHCYYNESSMQYHCELYDKIRETKGWENWQMSVVAIVNCANHNELMMEEQKYSTLCNATLSILHKEPTEPKKSSKKSSKHSKKSSKLYKKSSNVDENVFSCQVCQYTTGRKSNFNKHLTTNKHFIKIKGYKENPTEPLEQKEENADYVIEDSCSDAGSDADSEEEEEEEEEHDTEITTGTITDIYKEITVDIHADIHKEHDEDTLSDKYIVTPLQNVIRVFESVNKYTIDSVPKVEGSAHANEPDEHATLETSYIHCDAIMETPHDARTMQKHHHGMYSSDCNDSKYCKKCKKVYKSRNGLWKHKKVCDMTPLEIVEGPELNYARPINELLAASNQVLNANETLTHTVMDLIKQNQDLQKQLIELAKAGRNTIINNTTNNSFNLRVYLNETCKDAVNMMDFVNSLHLQLTDLEETGRLGYSNGMSRIFINGLKEMDACKRPIHCSDLKREILYIKEDNVWEKDTDTREKIKKAIRKIEQKNIQQIPLWIKAHPNCVVGSNRENIPYLKMVMQSTGGLNPDEESNMNKIISNIAKEVCINKECHM